MRQAHIFYKDQLAGILTENDSGYEFRYLPEYLSSEAAKAVSLALPLQEEIYTSSVLFPFFDGLIPEGWLLDVALRNTDISILDRMHNACVPMINLASFNIDGIHPLLSDAEFFNAYLELYNCLIHSILQSFTGGQECIRGTNWGLHFYKETHKICKNATFLDFIAYLHFVAW